MDRYQEISWSVYKLYPMTRFQGLHIVRKICYSFASLPSLYNPFFEQLLKTYTLFIAEISLNLKMLFGFLHWFHLNLSRLLQFRLPHSSIGLTHVIFPSSVFSVWLMLCQPFPFFLMLLHHPEWLLFYLTSWQILYSWVPCQPEVSFTGFSLY